MMISPSTNTAEKVDKIIAQMMPKISKYSGGTYPLNKVCPRCSIEQADGQIVHPKLKHVFAHFECPKCGFRIRRSAYLVARGKARKL